MSTASARALEAPKAGRPWGRAGLWLVVCGAFFFSSYSFANWLASTREHVGSVVFAWERHTPFWAWTIVPYWSIDAFYAVSLFVCATRAELDTHAKRLLTAQVIAVSCFIAFPLRFTFAKPASDGLAGFMFDSLAAFDQPFNQAPSLHIALLVILWVLYARHVPGWALWPLHAWFALVGVSVLTTYQHHFIDVPTGALLGFLCLWLWPDHGPSPLSALAVTRDTRRRSLAARYAIGSVVLAALSFWLGGWALWLLWPAVSLLLVAANYAVFGAAGFQKDEGGHMSLAARALLAPYLLAAWINSRLWTRANPAPVLIGDDVSLGRAPSRRDAARFASVVDLCAELPQRGTACHAVPLLDLVVPDATALRQAAHAIERGRARGPVLVCCALGYSRSAGAVAAWLLMTGRATTCEAAIDRIRRARPRIVVSDELRAAIDAAAV